MCFGVFVPRPQSHPDRDNNGHLRPQIPRCGRIHQRPGNPRHARLRRRAQVGRSPAHLHSREGRSIQGPHPPRSRRSACLRRQGHQRQDLRDRHQGEGAHLRQPHRALCAALPIQLLHQHLHLLPVPRQEQEHRAQEAHAGGDPQRSDRPSGPRAQAPAA